MIKTYDNSNNDNKTAMELPLIIIVYVCYFIIVLTIIRITIVTIYIISNVI